MPSSHFKPILTFCLLWDTRQQMSFFVLVAHYVMKMNDDWRCQASKGHKTEVFVFCELRLLSHMTDQSFYSYFLRSVQLMNKSFSDSFPKSTYAGTYDWIRHLEIKQNKEQKKLIIPQMACSLFTTMHDVINAHYIDKPM